MDSYVSVWFAIPQRERRKFKWAFKDNHSLWDTNKGWPPGVSSTVKWSRKLVIENFAKVAHWKPFIHIAHKRTEFPLLPGRPRAGASDTKTKETDVDLPSKAIESDESPWQPITCMSVWSLKRCLHTCSQVWHFTVNVKLKACSSISSFAHAAAAAAAAALTGWATLSPHKHLWVSAIWRNWDANTSNSVSTFTISCRGKMYSRNSLFCCLGLLGTW